MNCNPWAAPGEHFLTTPPSTAAPVPPVIGPDGRCAGMLDLTGIPGARNALPCAIWSRSRHGASKTLWLQAQPHHLLLRWAGQPDLGGDGDGLLAVARDGLITGFNPPAADMLG